jgi:predicted hydrocarbon binding protein
MNSQSISCCNNNMASVGGLAAPEFSTLDQLAVKLICLDRRFEASLREMGRLIGTRIAEGREKPIPFATALSSLLSGLEGVIEAAFLHTAEDGALLRITGCATVLGWQIPNLGRAVCSFDAGLFAGFLCGSTGEETWGVREVSCLGLGNPSCEFLIQRAAASQ